MYIRNTSDLMLRTNTVFATIDWYAKYLFNRIENEHWVWNLALIYRARGEIELKTIIGCVVTDLCVCIWKTIHIAVRTSTGFVSLDLYTNDSRHRIENWLRISDLIFTYATLQKYHWNEHIICNLMCILSTVQIRLGTNIWFATRELYEIQQESKWERTSAL